MGVQGVQHGYGVWRLAMNSESIRAESVLQSHVSLTATIVPRGLFVQMDHRF